ncbi:MAG TPA: XdhC family protein [Candidatus Cybelea sp.]|nr:XdhC family protein [Candidatus Cybelea sp.]
MTHSPDDTLSQIAALKAQGEDFCLVTVVRTENATSAKAGAKALVMRDGTIRGFLGGGCVQRAVRETAAAVIKEGRPRLIRVMPKDDVTAAVDVDGTELHRSFCPSGGTVDMFVEPVRQAPRVVVCGGSPVAGAVADLALRVGYRVAVAALAEDLPGFAKETDRNEGFELAPLKITSDDWVVVSTQGKRDREALAAALSSDAAYVSFVGSRRKAQVLVSQLRERGIAEDRLARLKAPAGLDIHGIEPAEIALSIMAEIVARRRSQVREDQVAAAFSGGADQVRPAS